MSTFSVVVLGSSGGGTATLGHTDPIRLLTILHKELASITGIQAGISRALMVTLGKSFDGANENDIAKLYEVRQSATEKTLSCDITMTASLKSVNENLKRRDSEIANEIKNGQVQGLVCISCAVELFSKTLQAAASSNIPVTGTGGTSLSKAAALYKIRLVGNAGGSVANTSVTRAVSYSHALAQDWNKTKGKNSYRPWLHNTADNNHTSPAWTSVLNTCLPTFWTVCLLKRLCLTLISYLQSLSLEEHSIYVSNLQFMSDALGKYALPMTACVTMAVSCANPTVTTQDTTSTLMAGTLATTACRQSVLAGLLAGWMVSRFQKRLLYWCIVCNIPATMTNLMTAGGLGGVIAIGVSLITPFLRELTVRIRFVLQQTVSGSGWFPSIAAFCWGCLCCYGSKVGWYHSVFLPLILVEMECGDASFLGAVDELTLVLVCFGISAGKLFAAMCLPQSESSTKADLALCKRAMYINFFCGDFVEACYPFMERRVLVNLGGYLGSGLSCVVLVGSGQGEAIIPKSLAYLPLPVSIGLAGDQWQQMALASLVAVGIPFLATTLDGVFAFLQSRTSKRDD